MVVALYCYIYRQYTNIVYQTNIYWTLPRVLHTLGITVQISNSALRMDVKGGSMFEECPIIENAMLFARE
jgi:hypothetical protein